MARKWFYLLLGFTFPFFWAFHAAGALEVLYYPVQIIASTAGTGWPSLITASLLYAVIAIVFEIICRTRKNLTLE